MTLLYFYYLLLIEAGNKYMMKFPNGKVMDRPTNFLASSVFKPEGGNADAEELISTDDENNCSASSMVVKAQFTVIIFLFLAMICYLFRPKKIKFRILEMYFYFKFYSMFILMD